MPIRVSLDHDAIATFCLRWALVELALFGSVLRDDFRPDSDIDVLVTFPPGLRPSLDDLLDMQAGLKPFLVAKWTSWNAAASARSGIPAAPAYPYPF